MKLFIATGNKGKLIELEEMVREFLPFVDFIEGRAPKNAEETEDTFQGNAEIKSKALLRELLSEGKTDFWVLSDDSGLVVDSLDGKPGVHSARYAGDHVDPVKHIEKLLENLEKFPLSEQRNAHYVCALSLLEIKNGKLFKEYFAEGYCHGQIAHELKGNSGFGYDPVFYVPKFNCHMAELDENTKNKISHRQNAFEKLEIVT